MNFDLYERRLKCLRYDLQGIPQRTWVADIAGEYGISERALWVDWNKRHEWMPIIYSISDSAEDLSRAVGEMVADTREARKELYRLYRSLNTDTAKVNALREIASNIKLELEMRQDMGLMPIAVKERDDKVGADETILRELLREHRESIQVEASALEHLHEDDLQKSLDTKNKQ